MPNRILTDQERESLFQPFIVEVRAKLDRISAGDVELLFALRRKLYKELIYDERGKPMSRKILKEVKRALQENKCAICGETLPMKNAVLDRLKAMDGYTKENTRLICHDCDTKTQVERGYK
jgi:hypothetical protein